MSCSRTQCRTPMKLEHAALGHESSTLPLSSCLMVGIYKSGIPLAGKLRSGGLCCSRFKLIFELSDRSEIRLNYFALDSV